MRLSRQVALVTGAANGIGEATARRLAQAGATVILADVDTERGTAIADELGAPHRFVPLDVSDEAQWREVTTNVKATEGRLQILFLNAGVLIRPLGAPAGDPALSWLTPERYRRVQRVNGDGVMYGVLYGFPLIRDSGGGIILANGSTAAVEHFAGDPTYSITKAGVIVLVRTLAAELEAAGVRICAVCPGSVDTRIYPRDRRSERAGTGQASPASPYYLANAVLTVIAHGRSGEIWFARADDEGFFTYEPPRLPTAPVQSDAASGRRFIPASIDGETVDGWSIHEILAG